MNAFSVDITITERHTDVIVIGSGIAGLSCALTMAPRRTLMLTKTASLLGGSSIWAQGGVAAALGDGDDAQQHAADTIAAGAGLVDPAIAHLLASEGQNAVRDMLAAGMPCDRRADGTLQLAREAAHSHPRVVKSGGDTSGRNITGWLARRVEECPSIEVLDHCFVVDLLVENGCVTGVLALHAKRGWMQIRAQAVVLASGGAGMLWNETTNPVEATGDGIALAARAGAFVADLEFMQFHPTALLTPGATSGHRMPLLTEAFRGAGAWLLDGSGERFMQGEHPMAELAPRDIVARAIGRRVARGEPVYLDLRPAIAAVGESHFPQGLSLCRQAGYEPTSEPVPVKPAAHYYMGGVWTDENGRTSVHGLWACGEVGATGAHGGNRLASNSLLEGVVFGRRVARDIVAGGVVSTRTSTGIRSMPPAFGIGDWINVLRGTLRRELATRVGIVRDDAGLAEVQETLDEIDREFAERRLTARTAATVGDFDSVVAWGELRNMLLVGRSLVAMARRRTESRGAHCRADYPDLDPDSHRSIVNLGAIESPASPAPEGERASAKTEVIYG